MDVAVPLISAAVAALVAWIVALRQGKTARENWVRDKRYEVYERILDAATDLLAGEPSSPQRIADIDDPEKRLPLVAALYRLNLIAPDAIHELGATIADRHYQGRFTSPGQHDGFINDVNALTTSLRDDLVPKQMR